MDAADLRVQFRRDGFAVLPNLATVGEIARVQRLLDPLFDRFDTFGDRAVDLAGPIVPGVGLRTAEIKSPALIQPWLRRTRVYRRCRQVARQLLQVPVGYVFDHAIFKQPNCAAPTDWHQDEAYNPGRIPLHTVHFWIPLQPVTESNGCLWFIPGSHRDGMLAHYPTPRSRGVNLVVPSVDSTTAVCCPLAVGDVTIHHPMTLHYAGANDSPTVRPAWILQFSAYGHMRALAHPRSIAARVRARRGRLDPARGREAFST